jgi:hypothetical protein
MSKVWAGGAWGVGEVARVVFVTLLALKEAVGSVG